MGFLGWLRGGLDDKLEPQQPQPQQLIGPPPKVPDEGDILRALDRTEQMASDAKLHPVVIARVKRVTRAVRETLPRVGAMGGSVDSYSVMATATDYLPEALSSYLRLPRDWADSRPLVDGKTSLMLLIDQLDLLAATMDKILDAVARQDANALVAHGRFLQEKFGAGAGGGDLELDNSALHDPAPPRNPLDLE